MKLVFSKWRMHHWRFRICLWGMFLFLEMKSIIFAFPAKYGEERLDGGWMKSGWRVDEKWMEGGWRMDGELVDGGWLKSGWRADEEWMEGGWIVDERWRSDTCNDVHAVFLGQVRDELAGFSFRYAFLLLHKDRRVTLRGE